MKQIKDICNEKDNPIGLLIDQQGQIISNNKTHVLQQGGQGVPSPLDDLPI